METPGTPPPIGPRAAALSPSTSEDLKHSGIGIASFAMSLGIAFAMIVVFAAAGVLHAHGGNGRYPGQMIVGLLAMALIAADLVAVVLGAVSLFQSQRKRIFGVLGLIFSGLTLIGMIGLIGFGLMVARHLH